MNITARSYLLAVIIVGLGILGEWGPPSFDGWWRLPAAAVILLLIIEGYLARHYQPDVQRLLPKTMRLGRTAHYTLSVRNNTALPLQLQTMDVWPKQVDEIPALLQWQLKPDTEEQQVCSITPIRLGKLNWQKMHVRVLGRFGLAWWSKRLTLPGQTSCVPDRLHSNEQRKAVTAQQGDTSRRVTGTGHELIGLRDYQSGDPLHFIDWKATARSQRPTVRIYSDEQHLELMLVIDAGRTSGIQAGKLTRLGHYTNVAARLAEKAIHNGDQVGIVVFSDNVMTSMKGLKGHNGLQRLRSILEQLETVPRESNPLPAIMQVRSLVQHRSLVVMLTDLDDGEAASQLVKSMSLLRPKHQPLLAAIMDHDVLTLQHKLARDRLDPYYSLAANEMIHNWQHTRVRLEGMGVPVVLSALEQLDSRVLGSYEQLKQQKRV